MPAVITGQYSLGSVLPLTEQAAYILGPMFDIKTIYGWREKDQFPDHPSGHALDFMIPDTATGDALAQYAIDHADELGIKYIVWNRQSWNAKRKTWVPYTATTNPHTDHVHITFNDTNSSGSTSPNIVGQVASALNPFGVVSDVAKVLAPVGTVALNLASPVFWRRVGMGVVGASLIFAGLVFINRRRIEGVGGAVGGLLGTAVQGAAFGAGAGATGAIGGGSRGGGGSGPVSGPGPWTPTPRPPRMLRSSEPVTAVPVTSPIHELYAPVSPGGTYAVTTYRGMPKDRPLSSTAARGRAPRPTGGLPDLGTSSSPHLGGRGKKKTFQAKPLWKNPLEGN